jgi:hypothetical protein
MVRKLVHADGQLYVRVCMFVLNYILESCRKSCDRKQERRIESMKKSLHNELVNLSLPFTITLRRASPPLSHPFDFASLSHHPLTRSRVKSHRIKNNNHRYRLSTSIILNKYKLA